MVDSVVQFAFDRLAGNDRGDVALGEDAFPGVEAELGLALIFIRPVTGVTLVREDGSDIPVELDGFRFPMDCDQEQ